MDKTNSIFYPTWLWNPTWSDFDITLIKSQVRCHQCQMTIWTCHSSHSHALALGQLAAPSQPIPGSDARGLSSQFQTNGCQKWPTAQHCDTRHPLRRTITPLFSPRYHFICTIGKSPGREIKSQSTQGSDRTTHFDLGDNGIQWR